MNWPDFSAWTPTDWSTAANWTTTFIAVGAVLFAWRQVREARRLREEQAQPYVAVYTEPNTADPQILDLVVKNFGTTVATDVRVDIDPPPRRAPHGSDRIDLTEVRLFDNLPVLVPGQEWRTMWDESINRAKVDLPTRYNVKVRYCDSGGKELPSLEFLIDWSVYERVWVTVYNIHHLVQEVKAIKSKLK